MFGNLSCKHNVFFFENFIFFKFCNQLSFTENWRTLNRTRRKVGVSWRIQGGGIIIKIYCMKKFYFLFKNREKRENINILWSSNLPLWRMCNYSTMGSHKINAGRICDAYWDFNQVASPRVPAGTRPLAFSRCFYHFSFISNPWQQLLSISTILFLCGRLVKSYGIIFWN